MKHFGDITKLNGDTVPTVDILVGGSPCQDLSVAGKRAGLAGERSGLFMEQIRLTKEMRDNDVRTGRTGQSVRPRFLVWENVPGAFSSNAGADFQAVLTEIAKIVEPNCPDVPLPKGGKWNKAGALFGMGEDGLPFSIAWRVHDAQFWGKSVRDADTGALLEMGTPQRRRRIALVADFGGLSAPEVLFERQSMPGDSESSGEAGQETTGEIGDGVEGTGGCLTGWDVQSKRIFSPDGMSGTLNSGTTEGMNIVPSVLAREAISFQERAGKPGGGKGILIQHEHVGALSTPTNQSVLAYGIDQQGGKGGANDTENVSPPILSDSHGTPHAVAYGVDVYNQDITGEIAAALTAASGGTNTSGPKVLCLNDQGGSVMGVSEDVTGALRAEEHGHQPTIVQMQSTNNQIAEDGIMFTLTARMGTGGNQVNAILEEQNPGAEFWDGTQVCATLTANNAGGEQRMPDKGNFTAVLQGNQEERPFVFDKEMYNCGKNCAGAPQIREDHVAPTCRADDHPSGVAYGSVVRRLTPKECERLQGFPDNWTNLGEWVDSTGKKHKDADSPRYRALGNSICLPFWQWMAKRIVAQYERTPTMASLFDGIGGFPLVFSRAGAVPVWASEIEEFPIAVTKRHFPEV